MNTLQFDGQNPARDALVTLLRREEPGIMNNVRQSKEEIVSCANTEGVITQAYDALDSLALQDGEDRHILSTFRAAAKRQTATTLMLRRERDRVLKEFAALEPVLLKGEALARFVYGAYAERPSGDMDILLADRALRPAETILESLGYRRQVANSGSLVMPQRAWVYELDPPVVSVVDLHTAILNRPALQPLLDYPRLKGAGGQAPNLDSGIILPCREHLLIHAVLHLLGHHGSEWRLIWLLDIHRLQDSLDPEQRGRVLALSSQLQISRAMGYTIHQVENHFGGDGWLADALNRQCDDEDPELSQLLLSGSRGQIAQTLADWRNLPDSDSRLTWLKQHLFPRSDYIRQRYDVSSTFFLPWFYLWRILRGGVKLLRPK